MMDNSKNRQNEYLGVNKIGKNIKKSPLHQPNFVSSNGNSNNPSRQPPQAQVYNICKSDFRTIVQQLTGSPSRQDPLPRPNTNPPPKHPSMRLQRIRPPPLTPINRGQLHSVVLAQDPMQMQPPPQGMPMVQVQPQLPYKNGPPQFGQSSPIRMQPFAHGDGGWGVPALSPISAYMQQLQSCIGDGSPRPNHMQQYPQMLGQFQGQPQMQSHALRHFQPQPQGPQPPMQPQTQPSVYPQGAGHVQAQSPGSGLLPNPNIPPLPSPGSNGPGLLPSPTSQFLLPSPSGFFNLLSPIPWSPYPLLSPGSQFPTPLSLNFAFSPLGQSGVLGSGPPPPLSPGYAFPLSPSGLFPISSPRWRDPMF